MLDGKKSWRSIRNYVDQQIADETIKKLLTAGKEKFDSMGDKAWSYTVIQNKKLIAQLNKVTKQDMIKKSSVDIIARLGRTPDFDMFYGAPTVIMISVKNQSKAISDAYAKTVHKIVNTAKTLGLAANWNSFVKYHFTEEVTLEEKAVLDIPEDFTPYYAISVGYAN